MKCKSLLGIVAAILSLLGAPVAAQSPAAPPQGLERPSPGTGVGAPPFSDTPCSPPFSWPLFTVILDHRGELALSPAQVEHLERLCLDVTREAIRRQADLNVGLLDIAVLLRPDPADPAKPIDMPKVEAALRAMERVDVDLDITRLRAIEEGKAQLTADQRSKLARLTAGDDPPNPGRPAVPAAPGSRPGTRGEPRPDGRPGAPGGYPGVPGAHPGYGRPVVAARPQLWSPYWSSPRLNAGPPIITEPLSLYGEQPGRPPGSFWYCPSSETYYPYATSCDQPWVPVPAWPQ